MTVSVELSEEVIADLKEVSKEQDLATGVRVAVSEYIKYMRRQQLKELSGRIEIQDNWRELDEAELESQH